MFAFYENNIWRDVDHIFLIVSFIQIEMRLCMNNSYKDSRQSNNQKWNNNIYLVDVIWEKVPLIFN